MYKCINGREWECDMRLINSYREHDCGTGFHTWLPNTPQYVKDTDRAWLTKKKTLQYERIE